MTLLVMHPACLAHEMGDGHPERPDRLRAIDRAFESEAFQMLARDIAPRADIAAIARVHPHEYVEALRAATPTRGFTVIDQDTSMSPATFEAALRSAGGAIFAVDEVMTGKATNAFVATRPPADIHDADGLLLLQQSGDRGASCADDLPAPSASQSSTSTCIMAMARSITSGTSGTSCTLRPMRCRFSRGQASLANEASTIRSSTRRCAQASRSEQLKGHRYAEGVTRRRLMRNGR